MTDRRAITIKQYLIVTDVGGSTRIFRSAGHVTSYAMDVPAGDILNECADLLEISIRDTAMLHADIEAAKPKQNMIYLQVPLFPLMVII